MAKTNNYKQIVVPVGTRLFRVSSSTKTFSFMRFGYCSRAAHMTSLSKIFYPIQTWIVKKDIYSALFISRVLENGDLVMATDEVFNALMGVEICAMCVPLKVNPGRMEFAEKLRNDFGIYSYSTSIISKKELELVLFSEDNKEYIEYEMTIDPLTSSDEQMKIYFEKSYHKIKYTGVVYSI